MKNFILFMLLLLSCVTLFGQKNKKRPEENQWSVIRIQDNVVPPDTNFFVYALPQTVFDIEITMTEKTVTPGRYQAYSKKYLTLEPLAVQKSYMIESVKLSTHNEIDPGFMYYFSAKHPIKESLQELLNSVCYIPKITEKSFTSPEIPPSKKEWLPFELKRTEDTQDTARNARRRIIVRSLSDEEQAAEVATQIFALRKRRIDLVTGEFELQSSEVLNRMLKEIDLLLSQYYELFLGETKVTQQVLRYTIIPQKDKLNYTVMQYSQDKGVCNNCNETLFLSLIPSSQFQQFTEPTLSNTFTYRLPEYVDAKVILGKQEYVSLRVPVYQLGKLVNIALP